MRRFLIISGRLLILAVACFWGWFVLVDGADHLINDPHKLTTLLMMILMLGPLAGLALAIWPWPRLAGILAVGLGVYVAWRFDHDAPRLLGALPLVVGGVALLAGRVWPRKLGRGGGGHDAAAGGMAAPARQQRNAPDVEPHRPGGVAPGEI